MKLPPLPAVAELLRAYHVRALKDLSQNFLLDTQITDKFVRSVGGVKNKVVIEVGGGPGSLTRSILKDEPQKLLVIEKDTRMLPLLNTVQDAAPDVMQIIHGDALAVDYEQLLASAGAAEPDTDVVVLGNLPFNVATPLIFKYLQMMSQSTGVFKYGPATMALCFQREVAQRLIAPPNTKARGRISVMAQYYARVRPGFVLPSHVFTPKPKVDGEVVVIQPIQRNSIKGGDEPNTHARHCVNDDGSQSSNGNGSLVPFADLEALLKAGFHSRRKVLHHNIVRLPKLASARRPVEMAKALIETCGLSPNKRAENLTCDQWAQLALAYASLEPEATASTSSAT
eukprot:m.274799 g.274799  ORF g.274799 m.274799 type:complete len:341 (-) comp15690_c0_seq2:1704-2726(-)